MTNKFIFQSSGTNNQKAARRTRIPPAPGRFRPHFHEEESRKNLDMLPKEWYGKNSYTTDGFKWN